MEKFTPQKIDLAAINEGNRYGYEGIQPDAINRPIESAAYTQALATTQPDVSEANNVGIPSVEIKEINGLPKFKFKNLKGEKGDSGVASGTVNSNTEGTSDTDGYTQQAVNKIASRPNILINPDFSINQRGQGSYTATTDTGHIYTVDRVRLHNYATPTLTPKTGGGISVSGTATGSNSFILSYWVEEFAKYAGKTLTLSIKFKNVTGTGVRVRTSSTGTGDYSASITTDTLYTKTFTVDSNATELSIILATGVAGNFSFDIDWWKLEEGSVATAFTKPLIAEELPKCQRYYCRYSEYTYFSGLILTETLARITISFPVTMRTTPTSIRTNNWVVYFNGTSSGILSTKELEVYSFSGNSITYIIPITGGTSSIPCVFGVRGAEFDAEIYG